MSSGLHARESPENIGRRYPLRDVSKLKMSLHFPLRLSVGRADIRNALGHVKNMQLQKTGFIPTVFLLLPSGTSFLRPSRLIGIGMHRTNNEFIAPVTETTVIESRNPSCKKWPFCTGWTLVVRSRHVQGSHGSAAATMSSGSIPRFNSGHFATRYRGTCSQRFSFSDATGITVPGELR